MIDLKLDLSSPGEKLNPIWLFGANTCHTPLWLRDDLLHHLDMAKKELGFQYIRAHGMLSDHVGLLKEDGSFDFTKIGQAYDRLLSLGLRPFVELSHLPKGMSKNEETITWYQFYGGPPKDWNQWYRLIKELTAFFVNRYGVDEVRQWYFEVWNEPDLVFWRGTKEEYWKLYDLAAKAVKEVDPRLRIGGPATSKTLWIDEFLAHVTKPSADFGLNMSRCDFISTHAYPSDIAFLDNDRGDVKLQNSNIMKQLFTEVRRKVDAVLGKDFPVICGEWNSSAGPLLDVHDECNNGPFVVKTLVELSEVCQGSLFWNLSDIYQECDFHYEPFHGGYGMITVNNIPKACYHSFAFLKEHAGHKVKTKWSQELPGLGCLASQDGDQLRLLIYYYQEPDAPKPEAATVKISGLKGRKVLPAQMRRVIPGQGSAYETWIAAGKPVYGTAALLSALEHASRPQTSMVNAADLVLTIEPGTMLQITTVLV